VDAYKITPFLPPQFYHGRGTGDKGTELKGGEKMIVLSAPGELSPNTKELLRKEVKEKLGEDCVILDCGIQITQISVKKDSATGGDQ